MKQLLKQRLQGRKVPLSAHPQLSQEEAKVMVWYILRPADAKSELKPLPAKGKLVTIQHKGKERSCLLITTDKSANIIVPLTTRKALIARYPE